MNTNAVRFLEERAIDAHCQGIGWSEFWQEHAYAIRAAEPYDRSKFRRLVNRLLSLVTAGNLDGQQPMPAGLLWGQEDCEETG